MHVSQWRLSAQYRSSMVIAALVFTALLGVMTTAAHAAPATAQIPEAPAATTEIWVDVESSAARASLQAISVQQSSAWSDGDVRETPFGSSAVFGAVPGAFDARFKAAEALTADLIVTFVDADGRMLDELVVRSARIDPASADADGWISLITIITGTDDGDGDGDGDNTDDGSKDKGTGDRVDRDRSPLSVTGSGLPIALGSIAVLLLGMGAALALRARRSRAARIDSEGDAS